VKVVIVTTYDRYDGGDDRLMKQYVKQIRPNCVGVRVFGKIELFHDESICKVDTMTTPVPMGCDHHGSCDVAYIGAMGCDPWKRRICHQVIAI